MPARIGRPANICCYCEFSSIQKAIVGHQVYDVSVEKDFAGNGYWGKYPWPSHASLNSRKQIACFKHDLIFGPIVCR